MGWRYCNPVRLVFERGALDQVGAHVECRRAVLVTTAGFRRRGLVTRIEESLGSRLAGVLDDVQPNPDLLDVDRQARELRPLEPDMVVALGGGSALDTAKGVARLLAQPGDRTLRGHFRDGETFADQLAIPITAIPTTAGTGAEVTPFGTMWDFERSRKYSVAGPDLYPRLALLDPDLTPGLPAAVTIASGLDAVSHALESCWNQAASPVTLGMSAQSLRLSLASLSRVDEAPDDALARTRMMEASLLAGLAISQTRTALAHSISYPLTTAFALPHGFACSFTLPALLRFNAEADDGRLMELARSLGHAGPDDLAAELERLFDKLGLPAYMAKWVPGRSGALGLVDQMFTPGRADNNLRAASEGDVRTILADSLAAVGVE